MKHIFEYEGKKSIIESGGRKQEGSEGIHCWFGAPPEGMLPLYIRSARADKWYLNSYTKRINSSEFSIEFPQSGQFAFTQNGQTFPVGPGEVFLIRKQSDNQIRCKSSSAEKFAAVISGTLLDSILKTLRMDQVDIIPLSDPDAVRRSFEKFFELSRNMDPENFRAANAECYRLLMELSSQTGISTQPPDLRDALQYINQNLSRNLTLPELCHATGYSSATLTRKFQRSFQKSPMEYFLDRKLEKARELLIHRIYSVKQVAALLNYSSLQYFSSQFSHRFGVSPSKIMRNKT
jgi:AraC-like DNA-binding protein